MTEAEKGSTPSRFWKRIGMIVLVVFLSLLSLSLIVQIPAVQNWGIRYLTRHLSERTGSNVTVKSFDFNIFSHIRLNDVFFSQENAPADTLLSAEVMGLKFSRIWRLINGSPEISELRLEGGRLYIDDRPLTFMRLAGGERKQKSAGIYLIDPDIIVEDVEVRVQKSTDKLTHTYRLPRGSIHIDEINTALKTIRVGTIAIDNPSVILFSKPDSLVMETNTLPAEITGVKDSAHWHFQVERINIENGQVHLYDATSLHQHEQQYVDYHDLLITNLNTDLRNISIDSGLVTGAIEEISMEERSGFRIEKISAGSLRLSDQRLLLGALEMRTNGSTIADSLALDFGKEREGTFAERMNFYARFRDSEIAFADLLMAIPTLAKTAFFAANKNEILRINGVVRGSPSRLRGDSLALQLGNMVFNGQFRSRDLNVKGRQVLNLEIADARFTADDLSKHLPGADLPEQFDKLGRIRFRGKFDGFIEDFVAYGQLNTDIGNASVDMNLKTRDKVATYEGELNLQNFDLKKWTDVNDFGLVSASLAVKNGSGLTPETARADLTGNISGFEYKGYTYKDVRIDGGLNQNQFNGNMAIDDPNLRLDFKGTVNIQDGIPVFDFIADIEHADLQKLNLSKESFTVSGVFDARGRGMNLDSLTGVIRATDLQLLRGNGTYALDTLFFEIERDTANRRAIRTRSDYVNGWITGDFSINTLYPSLARFLEESYPQYFSGLKYKKELAAIRHYAQFELTLNDPEEWGGLVDLQGVRFKDLHMKGIMDFVRDSVVIDINAPELHYNKASTYLSTFHLESIRGEAEAQAFVTVLDIGEKYFFDEITASVQTYENGFAWSLGADDLLEELNTLGLSGTITFDSNNIYSLHIAPQIIEVLEQEWELRDGNRIRFGKDFIELDDIVFQHEQQMIAIDDINRRGVMIETRQFDLSFIDEIWDYKKLDFAGPYTLRAGLSDIFEKTDFYLTIDAPEIFINNDNYGTLRVSCGMENLGSPVSIFTDLDHTGVHLSAKGTYFPPIKEVEPSKRSVMELDVDIDTFPVNFLEYFLKGAIRNTTGYAIGKLKVSGPMKGTTMNGDAIVHGGATTVSYLGTRYSFDKQKVHITESVIDATGTILTDESGNTASVIGGLTHKRLADLGLNATISSSRINALNTTRADNSTYYGKGVGQIVAVFTGLVDRPTISIDAVTDFGTSIVINLTGESAARKQSFIKFRDEVARSGGRLNERTTITGMNFEMNLTATPDASVEIVLEENPTESILGSGRGDIQMSISRSGDFTMYGQYEIDQGSYLFRNLGFINKPFALRQGGSIQWTGDPYNADINIAADYVGLRASVAPLIAEYLSSASQEVQEEASRKTDVHLTLLLTGTLLEPDINFDFSFPQLSGELAGLTDTKLRILKSNQNALNEQVFGLLWAGSFLPSNILQTDASVQLAQEGFTNSVTEFLSAQVSSLFSGVISRWVEDVGFISGIDFNVDYSQGSQFDLTGVNTAGYNEWEVRLKNRLFNDRFIIDAGANYGTNNLLGSGDYLVGDYALEYLLTQDGRLKVRFYHRIDYEQTVEGRRSKVGMGLAWRREFDSFEEWLGGLKSETKKMRDGEIQ